MPVELSAIAEAPQHYGPLQKSNEKNIAEEASSYRWPPPPPLASIGERFHRNFKIGVDRTRNAGALFLSKPEPAIMVATLLIGDRAATTPNLTIAIKGAIKCVLLTGAVHVATEALFNACWKNNERKISGDDAVKTLKDRMTLIQDRPKVNPVSKKIVQKVLDFTEKERFDHPDYSEKIAKMTDRVLDTVARGHLPELDSIAILQTLVELNQLHRTKRI